MKKRKNRKNRVIHEVIHIIHRKSDKFCGLHSKTSEQKFCAHTINMQNMGYFVEKCLTIEM